LLSVLEGVYSQATAWITGEIYDRNGDDRLFIVISRAQRYLLRLICLGVAIVTAHAQEISTIDQQRPFSINGGFGLSSSAYDVSGIDRREQPFAWTINGASTA